MIILLHTVFVPYGLLFTTPVISMLIIITNVFPIGVYNKNGFDLIWINIHRVTQQQTVHRSLYSP